METIHRILITIFNRKFAYPDISAQDSLYWKALYSYNKDLLIISSTFLADYDDDTPVEANEGSCALSFFVIQPIDCVFTVT